MLELMGMKMFTINFTLKYCVYLNLYIYTYIIYLDNVLNAHRELLVSINLLLFYFDFRKEAEQLLMDHFVSYIIGSRHINHP